MQASALPRRGGWPACDQGTVASVSPQTRGSGRTCEEGFEVLAGDDAAAADLQVGQLAGAHLVIEQVAGQPGDRCGLIDAVGQPLV